MKKITERQTNLVLKALTFYRKYVLETGLAEITPVIKRIDLLYRQLLESAS